MLVGKVLYQRVGILPGKATQAMLNVMALQEKHVGPQDIIEATDLSSHITVVLDTLLVLGKAVATPAFSLRLRPFRVRCTTAKEFGDFLFSLTRDEEIILLCDGKGSNVMMV